MTEARAGKSNRYSENFLLDEAKLRKIADIIDTYAKKLGRPVNTRYRAYLADKSFYDSDTADKVLQDDNSKKKKIARLFIELLDPSKPDTEERPTPIVRIDFDTEDNWRIFYHIAECDRDWCFLLADELEQQIDRCKRGKFWVFMSRPIAHFLVNLTLVVIVFGAAWFLFGRHYADVRQISDADFQVLPEASKIEYLRDLMVSEVKRHMHFVAYALVGFLFFMFMGYFDIVTKMARHLQGSVFYWGDEATAYDRRQEIVKRIKWGVVVAFLVSVVAGFAVWKATK